jgi:CheY-like chemotaxis protein
VKKTKKCFLIDDDLDDQEIFLMALQEIDENISCHFANNGIEGLEKLNQDHSYIPDYIFLDINMPKMNGMECLPEIKKLNHLQGVKIIMYSTSADKRMMHESRTLGANDFLVKPPGMQLLIENLSKILKS